MKKIFYIVFFIITAFSQKVFANPPEDLLPDLPLPWGWGWDYSESISKIWWDLISTFISYVAIIAVIALMISWIMYLVANWDEEKTKKAKNAITWSLVWVLLSISAWGIIAVINNLTINLS